MTDPLNEPNIREMLAQYADGELSAEQSARALELVAASSDAARVIASQQKLRSAVGRVMHDSAPPLSLDSRQRVLDLIREEKSLPLGASMEIEDAERNRAPVNRANFSRFIYRWSPVAIAAGLLIAASIVVSRQPAAPSNNNNVAIVPVATWTEPVIRRHVLCARFAKHFHPEMPQSLTELPAKVEQIFGHTGDCPDLVPAGYQFAGAGYCPIPGGQALHIIYRPTSPSLVEAVSLFIQGDKGQVDIPQDKPYLASNGEHAHSMIVWRKDGLIYYLVTDSKAVADKVAKQIGL